MCLVLWRKFIEFNKIYLFHLKLFNWNYDVAVCFYKLKPCLFCLSLIFCNTRLHNQDLENYIRNHPEARLARIQSLAKELTDVDVMPGTVQAEAEGLTARWSQLSQKVSIKQSHTSFTPVYNISLSD